MAVMTISINDQLNERFREFVKRKFGEEKGVIAKAIQEAINKLMKEDEQNKIAEEMLQLMEEGVGTLKGWKFKREELYDRK